MKRRFVCADGGEYILDTPEPRYLRKKRRKKTIAAVVLSVCLLVIGAAVYFQRNVTKVLIAISEATMRSFTTVAINDAIYYTLSDGVRYEDLVSIERSEAGAITAVSANALKINKIARDAASISQANLKNLSLNGIPVPLGALTGIEALAGFGPRIHIRIIPVSSVTCAFSSDFESVGINQTKHRIVLRIDVYVSILLPGYSAVTQVSNEITVAETVIVGEVPDTYTYFATDPEAYASDAKDYILNKD